MRSRSKMERCASGRSHGRPISSSDPRLPPRCRCSRARCRTSATRKRAIAVPCAARSRTRIRAPSCRSSRSRSERGARRIAARELFASYFTTTLEPGEIIVSATFPAVQSGWGYAFEEFAERHGDFAIVATACALRVDAQGALAELRLAIGGVDERPVQAQTQRYAGRALDATAIGEIAADVSRALEPPSDRRGSAGYRHFLCRSQVARVIARALDEARA